jgi:hypothetical protein
VREVSPPGGLPAVEGGASIKEDLDARRVRAAKNQSLLREVNERIERLAEGMRVAPSGNAEIDLACECMDETCTERVTMTIAEYEAVRSDSNMFFVRQGHHYPDVEELVREEPAYIVVRKIGAGAPVAKKLDPRTREKAR